MKQEDWDLGLALVVGFGLIVLVVLPSILFDAPVDIGMVVMVLAFAGLGIYVALAPEQWNRWMLTPEERRRWWPLVVASVLPILAIDLLIDGVAGELISFAAGVLIVALIVRHAKRSTAT